MYNFIFNVEKNNKLKAERQVSFEMVIHAIENGKLIRTITHPNADKYKNQKMFIVEILNYAYVVPFIEDAIKKEIVLKTVFPSRKMTKLYINKKGE